MINDIAARAMQAAVEKPAMKSAQNPTPDAGFGDLLNRAIDKVNAEQVKADDVTRGYLTGEVEDLHQVMIQVRQADLTLQLALEVRNKVLEAYQEIARIPV